MKLKLKLSVFRIHKTNPKENPKQQKRTPDFTSFVVELSTVWTSDAETLNYKGRNAKFNSKSADFALKHDFF